ncbi:MAG: tRNA (N6-threonylcarbamoyladenosine(37)-N6)-methyltransferase TrmO [Bacteroidales bacterium]|jgi:tRNA-Thr(GGU) m(6)t(6)A37 methyltransferase TsaA|nr:tRNA (N6-threonylcarbamoyladenosine(37)-N6)-methyltransferase TrmO [Bacteroidales bacterium]
MNKKRLIFITFTILILLPTMGQGNKKETISYRPIGVFHTDYTPETGAPRQGILKPEGKGRIEIYPEYRDALKSLDLFEYIIVIYHFDRSGKWKSTVNPPESNPDYKFGLFATRSPNRPNPIGIATIKLESVEDGILTVSGIDAFNGTPVLDIKPYLSSIDGIRSEKNDLLEKELGIK